ncbi:hypothetical protein CSOJ01_08172 [Colletotrichum sojae]|uniref:Uncharacterized protein n=1 Tax=Colletotrichum sojae TaxID=2175907 RepID=A0A8H6J7A2_9PEZI|nr:hypothetical protein CSOJ01_08172 [Colletotrichum sojae]
MRNKLHGKLTSAPGKEYPQFINDGREFADGCPEDRNLSEYPLKKKTPYDGGRLNKNQDDERVIYYYEDGDTGYDGNPRVIYCGKVTHEGAGKVQIQDNSYSDITSHPPRSPDIPMSWVVPASRERDSGRPEAAVGPDPPSDEL